MRFYSRNFASRVEMGLVSPGGASLAVTSRISPAAQGRSMSQDARMGLRCESRRGEAWRKGAAVRLKRCVAKRARWDALRRGDAAALLSSQPRGISTLVACAILRGKVRCHRDGHRLGMPTGMPGASAKPSVSGRQSPVHWQAPSTMPRAISPTGPGRDPAAASVMSIACRVCPAQIAAPSASARERPVDDNSFAAAVI